MIPQSVFQVHRAVAQRGLGSRREIAHLEIWHPKPPSVITAEDSRTLSGCVYTETSMPGNARSMCRESDQALTALAPI